MPTVATIISAITPTANAIRRPIFAALCFGHVESNTLITLPHLIPAQSAVHFQNQVLPMEACLMPLMRQQRPPSEHATEVLQHFSRRQFG